MPRPPSIHAVAPVLPILVGAMVNVIGGARVPGISTLIAVYAIRVGLATTVRIAPTIYARITPPTSVNNGTFATRVTISLIA